jgi:hypothetical protein
MTKRIDTLTEEQQSRFKEWAQKWIQIGLSTEPADFDAASEAALKAYALCNLKKPVVILRMGSPYAATIGGALAWSMLKDLKFPQVRDQVRAQVGDQVRDQVRAQVRDQVGDQVGDQVWDQVWDQVGDQVWDQVWDQEFQAAKDGLNNDGASNVGWASFAAWVSFFRDVCGWENEKLGNFEITETLVKSCGWTWWHQNVLAISDRPASIKRDDAGRLHCEDGPSMLYRDGWSLWHWHGVSIPPEWVTGKKPSATEALKWPNTEQRRAACEIVGWASILKELNARVINTDADPEIGTLVECELPDAGKERFLRVQCGTGREFALCVPPTMKTAKEANSWTYSLPSEELQPEVRT